MRTEAAYLSAIKVLLDKILNNVPLQVRVNKKDVELSLQFLEEDSPYNYP